jgi:TadE-like protein
MLHRLAIFRARHSERGATAVEMAIVMPLLVVMIMGIIDFSRVFNAELQLSQAAREGARLASLLPQTTSTAIAPADVTAIQNRTLLAATNPAFGASLPRTGISVVSPYCIKNPSATDVATVRVDYAFKGIGPWFPITTLRQTAVMRCSG